MTEPALTPISSLGPIEPERSRSGKRVLLVMLAIVVLGAIPAVVIPMMWQRGKPPKLVDMGALPSFRLTDERGHVFTEDAFRHQQTIVGFVFTRCDTICVAASEGLHPVIAPLSGGGCWPFVFGMAVYPTASARGPLSPARPRSPVVGEILHASTC